MREERKRRNNDKEGLSADFKRAMTLAYEKPVQMRGEVVIPFARGHRGQAVELKIICISVYTLISHISLS